MPIAPPQGQGPAAVSGEAPQQSFRERKAAELAAESGTRREQEGRPPTDRENPTRRERTPSQPAGSTEDFEEDGQDLEADDEYEGDDQGDLFEDPDDGTPSDDDEEGYEESGNWQKRYQDLQAEYTRMAQERGEITEEHSQAMGETLRLRFDLEDRLNEAAGRAEYMANVMSGNANQYRNINWSQVPAEQLPQLQAQAQQALAMEQQAKAAWEQIQGQREETMAHVKQREAAIAKIRLRRTIPNWGNETYAKLREFAVNQGMPVKQFNDTTDPVVIEALHALMTLRTAGKNVQTKFKRKAQAPRGKTGRVSRDARGRFAEVVPNQRGTFAEKARQRLERESRGR